MASNYDDVLRQLQLAGLKVEYLDVGRMRRCKTVDGGRDKNGWYILHDLRLDSGEEVLVGSYGIWSGNNNNAQKIDIERSVLSEQQREALKQRLAADRKRSEAVAKAVAEKAAARAAAAWKRYSAVPHEGMVIDYLQRKAVHGHGVRYSEAGSLIVPMQDVFGSTHGLQIIRGRNRPEGKREKEYWPVGLSKAGKFHTIGSAATAQVVIIVEGYATGASIYEAMGGMVCVVVAFDANNLLPVAQALRAQYRTARILICADDDKTQRCHHAAPSAQGRMEETCKQRIWLGDDLKGLCPHCGNPHKASNAGESCASTAAMAIEGIWIAPQFADPSQVRAEWLEQGKKCNDFNDLHVREGLSPIRRQIEAAIDAKGWTMAAPAVKPRSDTDKGEGERVALRPIYDLAELLERYSLIYGIDNAVFDHVEHRLVSLTDMSHMCGRRDLYRDYMEHPDRHFARDTEVGFDPTERDRNILCNMWSGWPMLPKSGKCEYLLDLLLHMCNGDEEVYKWVLRWLAYPLQHPGAKMQTTIVLHGPQGTGKNLFFEVIMSIYGQYGRVIDQNAIEDKFNDWASRMLFLIADEVVARQELYKIKNMLKSLITGQWIRINSKMVKAYQERNHVNMVFLSNETLPVVLEVGDRRHCVIWTPAKLSQAFYADTRAEIANGGTEALYDYLLHMDLGDFDTGTLPPMTQAKNDLINVSKDSSSQFVDAFTAGDIAGFPAESSERGLAMPCLSNDLYELYKAWCSTTGHRASNQNRFIEDLKKKHNATANLRKRYRDEMMTTLQGSFVILPGAPDAPLGTTEADWLGQCVHNFRSALKEYKGAIFK